MSAVPPKTARIPSGTSASSITIHGVPASCVRSTASKASNFRSKLCAVLARALENNSTTIRTSPIGISSGLIRYAKGRVWIDRGGDEGDVSLEVLLFAVTNKFPFRYTLECKLSPNSKLSQNSENRESAGILISLKRILVGTELTVISDKLSISAGPKELIESVVISKTLFVAIVEILPETELPFFRFISSRLPSTSVVVPLYVNSKIPSSSETASNSIPLTTEKAPPVILLMRRGSSSALPGRSLGSGYCKCLHSPPAVEILFAVF